MHRKYALAAMVLGTLAFAACGDENDSKSAASTTAPDASNPRTEHEDQDCYFTEFDFDQQTAERDDRLDVLLYTATAGPSDFHERMTLDFLFGRGATNGPHEYVFTDEDLTECHTCLVIQRGCADESCSTGQTFLAESGELSLTEMGPIGGPLRGTLTNAFLTEVTIDPDSRVATRVSGGETWCVEDHNFDIAVE